jgi:WD40 repeat protein
VTTFDRIERRLPELIDDLASATVPDYFDDMLQRTTRSRQRPSWSSLERWLPMGVIAQRVPVRQVPWRPIAMVALLGLLAAAALIYAGSRQHTPPPFGPARNGALVIATADGDILTVDPATGSTTPLITGPTVDTGPFFSNDGQRIVFDRAAASTPDLKTTFIANADGTGVRPAFPTGPDITWFDWAPNIDHAVLTETVDGRGTLATVDLATGARTALPLDLDVQSATWRPNHDQIVVTAKAGDNVAFWVVDSDGTDLRQIPVSEYAINEPTLSPDGTRLAYATWEPVVQGRIRVVDIDAGGDHSITTDETDHYVWQTPAFSPDGSQILVHRFIQGTYQSQVAVLRADGAGPAIVMGPETGNPAANPFFSPDGTKILAEYPALKTFWIFDANGQNGHEAPFAAKNGGGATWQRVAP